MAPGIRESGLCASVCKLELELRCQGLRIPDCFLLHLPVCYMQMQLDAGMQPLRIGLHSNNIRPRFIAWGGDMQ